MTRLPRFRNTLATSVLPLFGALALVSDAAHAGGFALYEMSAGSLGNAHAGGAAVAEDLSTIYFNPAGLTRFQGRQFMGALSAIRPSAEFRNAGSTGAGGAPLTGGNGGDAGDWAAVPALYYAMDLNPRMRFGIGIQSPFGLKTEYDSDWVGRYQALKSELRTININPTIAFKLNDQLSLGAGVSAQYADVEISRAINLGALVPGAPDARVTIDGDDWGYGFNLGVMFAPNEHARFGAAYRSRIRHKFSGDARYTLPAGLPAAVTANPALTNTGASADLDLPESVSLSGYLDLDRQWSAMADVTWMHWSRFKELRVRFNNGAPESVTPENFRNTVRVAVGANYRYNDMLKLRGGIAYDRSPVRDEFRTPRVPDENRWWLSFGAQYKPSRQGTWEFGFAHLFVKDARINKSEPPAGGTLVGEYDSDVNILSVQYSHAF
ncbi:MAG TPA: outer membrane protein transport protein [Noviherbaspirillum sp.]|nr:outer membrane protein transport protein [Noviherbaspirillum sp.]